MFWMNCNYQYLLLLQAILKFDLLYQWNQKKKSEVKCQLVFCCFFQGDLENTHTPTPYCNIHLVSTVWMLFLSKAQSRPQLASNIILKKYLKANFSYFKKHTSKLFMKQMFNDSDKFLFARYGFFF